MKVLTLAVKKIYFDQIKSGAKRREFRLVTPYWVKRLEGRNYDIVTITLGYPKRDDHERRLSFRWLGYSRTMLTHEHFGDEPVKAFAIDLSEPIEPSFKERIACDHSISRSGCCSKCGCNMMPEVDDRGCAP